MSVIVDGEQRHSSKRDSYIRAEVRKKNLIKSREIEMMLSACLQEDSDNTTATELYNILQTKRSAAGESLPANFVIN